MSSERLKGLSAAKRMLFQRRLQGKIERTAALSALERMPEGAPMPLSSSQERLWFLDRIVPGNPAYHLPMALHAEGQWKTEALAWAMSRLVERHAALRTTFVFDGGRPFQMVHPPRPVPLPRIDLTALPAAHRADEQQRLVRTDARRPFDLASGPLFRTSLLHLGLHESLLLLTLHHIVGDGWSVDVILRELSTLYGSAVHGITADLPELDLQYADFAHWQRERLRKAALESDLRYWREAVRELPPALELPWDRPRQALPSPSGAVRNRQLPPGLAQAVKALGQSRDATLFMTLLAAFQGLLARICGQTDVVVGTAVAGRDRRELEPLVGFFINVLVLRTEVPVESGFAQLLGRTRRTVVDAFVHQELPFEKLVESVQPQREGHLPPFFHTLFVVQATPPGSFQLPGLRLSPVPVDTGTAKLDLSLFAVERDGGIGCAAEYRTDLFDGTTIDRLLGHLEILLSAATADPERRLSELPLLSVAERHQLLVEWSLADPGGRALVLDPSLEPLPIGAAGNLLTGREEMRLGDQALPDPFGPPGACLIQTGERARWRSDGSLEHLGRLDARAATLPLHREAGTRWMPTRPRSEMERALARVWSEILGRDQVGVDESFFDLGGHSLLLAELQSRIRETLGREIPLLQLLEHPTIAAQAAWLEAGNPAEEKPTAPEERSNLQAAHGARTDIAIIGMTGRFPGAPDLDRFWENLRSGAESIELFSEAELLAAGADPALLRDPAFVPAAALLPDVDLFDAELFGFPPREAELMDPQQRVFLECAWEALETAGYDSRRPPGRIGVFAASGTNEYLLFHLLPRMEGGFHHGLQTTLGNEKDFLATRVSYELGLRGPSLTVQTGCSSGLVALHLACQSLTLGDCDMALIGAVSLQIPRVPGYLCPPGSTLSPDGHCRAFSAGAQGTVAGSGVGVVVLKRLADAVAAGDTVRAVLRGSAFNNDGESKVGYAAPSVEGQAEVVERAQAAAGVEPRSITFVEGHGSGTPLGDSVEVAALIRAFRRGTQERGFCALGSVKTNVGHLDRAAGLAGLIKTVLALEHRQIPPTLHADLPNPQIDWASSPFFVSSTALDWPAGTTPRRAGVSAFGIGGTNVHVILEEAPSPIPGSAPRRPWEVLVLSARSEPALESLTDRLADHLERRPVDLPDVAWTLQNGRRRLAHRRILVCRGDDRNLAARHLRTRDPQWSRRGGEAANDPPVVFLFPGLGEHVPGMAADLYRDEPVFREEIERCAEVLAPFGLDLPALLFPPALEGGASGGIDLAEMIGRAGSRSPGGFTDTAFAQPALFSLELALARLWMSWGIRPAAVFGYSLGEYVAACVAGVLDCEEALRLVAERARLIGGLPPGSLLAVVLPEEELRSHLSPPLAVAAANGPALTVVAGPPEEVQALEQALANRGIATRMLPATHAFHSPCMAAVADPLRRLLARVALRPPSIPWVSGVTGRWVTDREAADPGHWIAHLLQPVRLGDALGMLWGDPAPVLLEVGPGQGLGSLARQHPAAPEEAVIVASLRSAWERKPDGAVLLTALGRLWIAGCSVDWTGAHPGARRRRVPLPAYPFERQRYWVGPPLPWPLSTGSPAGPPSGSGMAPAGPAVRREVARQSAAEELVAGVFGEVLGRSSVGAEADFFDLGGDSLQAMQATARLREVFEELSLKDIFNHRTVAALATRIEDLVASSASSADSMGSPTV